MGPLSDLLMLAKVGGLVLIDVVTLLAWELADPLQHNQVTIGSEVGRNLCFVIWRKKIATKVMNEQDRLTNWLI